MKLHFYIFSILLFLTSCQSEEKCAYSPSPIFKEEWAKVTKYNYEAKGKKSTEQLTFPNGVRLELFQTVCNSSQQEYHFYLQGDFTAKEEAFWIQEAARQFFYMAGVGKAVESLAMWGVQIQNEPERYVLGEKVEVGNGISIKIDKLVGNSDTKLMITTAQEVD